MQARNPLTTGCGMKSTILEAPVYPMANQRMPMSNVERKIRKSRVGKACSSVTVICDWGFVNEDAHNPANIAAMISGPLILIPSFEYADVYKQVTNVDAH